MIKLFLAALLLVPHLAFAQSREPSDHPECAPIQDIASGLAKHAGEHPLGMGKLDGSKKNALILFTNPKTGTFTAIILKGSGSSGVGCGIMSGEGWRAAKQAADEDSEDE